MEIEFHKIRENGKETEMVETNFLPSRGLLQGKVKETFEWKGEVKMKKIIHQSIHTVWYTFRIVQFTKKN